MTIKPKPLQGTSRTLDEWKEFARHDDCLDQMVPSDLRCILSAIEAVDTATIRAESLREALQEIERLYYTEGKDASWRAAQMRAIATAALIDKEQDQ